MSRQNHTLILIFVYQLKGVPLQRCTLLDRIYTLIHIGHYLHIHTQKDISLINKKCVESTNQSEETKQRVQIILPSETQHQSVVAGQASHSQRAHEVCPPCTYR